MARIRVSIVLSALIFFVAYLLLGSLELAMLFLVGVIAGYLCYEMIHLIAHVRWRVPLLSRLCRYHLRHHFGNAKRSFGVTSPLWDWVFGTLPRKRNQAGGS